jgi:hypothetical protein
MAGPLFFWLVTIGEICGFTVIQLELLTYTLASASVMTVVLFVMDSMSKLSADTFNNISNCTTVTSIVTNILSTLLIGYKLWLINIFL